MIAIPAALTVLGSRALRVGAVVLAVLAVLGILWFSVRAYGNSRYDTGVKDAKAEAQRVAELQYKEDVNQLAATVDDLRKTLEVLSNAEPEIRTKYITVRESAPLPDTCRIDANRLSIVNGAIQASNAASGAR